MINSRYANVETLKSNGYKRVKVKLFWHKPQGTFVYKKDDDDYVYYYQYTNRAYKRTLLVKE